jgi:uncharacterized membrane protein YccF (DUF307 family)
MLVALSLLVNLCLTFGIWILLCWSSNHWRLMRFILFPFGWESIHIAEHKKYFNSQQIISWLGFL